MRTADSIRLVMKGIVSSGAESLMSEGKGNAAWSVINCTCHARVLILKPCTLQQICLYLREVVTVL